MGPLDLALSYLEIFFSGRDLERLRNLFAHDLRFEGPFHQSDSAEAYIQTLQADPPKNCAYQIIETFEQESRACVVYQFSKPGISVVMSQQFETHEEKITHIRLIFDTAPFRSS